MPSADSAHGMHPTPQDRSPSSRPSHTADQIPDCFTEVVSANKGYWHYFFAFTPECMRLEEGQPCQDDQFGVTNLNGKPGFIPNGGIDNSSLSKQIVNCIGEVVGDYDASNYMQINYEAPEIQAAVMRANMPLARFIVYCPPCISAITTAVHLCQENGDVISEWSIRVESVLIPHRVLSP